MSRLQDTIGATSAHHYLFTSIVSLNFARITVCTHLTLREGLHPDSRNRRSQTRPSGSRCSPLSAKINAPCLLVLSATCTPPPPRHPRERDATTVASVLQQHAPAALCTARSSEVGCSERRTETATLVLSACDATRVQKQNKRDKASTSRQSRSPLLPAVLCCDATRHEKHKKGSNQLPRSKAHQPCSSCRSHRSSRDGQRSP